MVCSRAPFSRPNLSVSTAHRPAQILSPVALAAGTALARAKQSDVLKSLTVVNSGFQDLILLNSSVQSCVDLQLPSGCTTLANNVGTCEGTYYLVGSHVKAREVWDLRCSCLQRGSSDSLSSHHGGHKGTGNRKFHD